MKSGRFRKYFTDYNISLLIRWWVAGAIYFFVGWGTSLGNQQSIIDFVFSLGLVIGLLNVLIVNRVLRMMFNLGSVPENGSQIYWQRLTGYLGELLKSLFIVFMILLIYVGINRALVAILSLSDNAVPLPGEPILFGLFYILLFAFVEWLLKKAKGAVGKSK